MKRDTWRVVLVMIGIVAAVAGAMCVAVLYGEKISAALSSLGKKRSACPEFDDFDDGPLNQ